MSDENVSEENGWKLSYSVSGARDEFGPKEQITAGNLVEEILNQGHRTEYAQGEAADWSPDTDSTGAAQQTADDWIAQVKQLFDPQRADSSPPELYGRLTIVGLAMLDPPLQQSLQRAGILAALRDEMASRGPTDEDLLTAKGRALRERRNREDQLSPLSDTPLKSVDADRLQRADFASYLAERVAYIRLSTDDAFSILLYGPWGSGKTTLFNFLSEELHQRRRVILSESVEQAAGKDLETEVVTADELADAIIAERGADERTPDGGAPAPAVADGSEPAANTRQTLTEWFEEVRTLYVHDRVRTLDAPLVLLGLAMLEPQLRDSVIPRDHIQSLIDELSAPLEDVLSDRGQVLADDEDFVERDSDAAADAAGTAAAEESEIPPAEQAWQIVRFNAWQHQHVDPPWWALLDRIYQASKSELSTLDRLYEYLWRRSSRRLAVLAGSTLLVWALVIVVLPQVLSPGNDGGSVLSWMATIAGDVGTLFALLVTLWAGISAVSKPLFLDSSRAAQSYVKFSNEPMTKIQGRFNTLVERVPKHLLVFIDDLDRCQSEYVVELLEGIQTLFKNAPVIFIVAADNRWVETCFEQEYDGHTDAFPQPGKTLGMRFSEKAFQLSAPVPGVPETLHEAYWWHLIDVTPNEREVDKPKGHQPNKGGDGNEGPRRSDVKRWALPEVKETTEHLLQDFQPLLEQNPRAMKQLVNAYSMNRALATLTRVSIDRETLALWTILSLRWPRLATHLKRSPDDIEKIRRPGGDEDDESDENDDESQITEIEEDLRPLFSEPAVVDVVTGAPDSVRSTLDAADVRDCAQLTL